MSDFQIYCLLVSIVYFLFIVFKYLHSERKRKEIRIIATSPAHIVTRERVKAWLLQNYEPIGIIPNVLSVFDDQCIDDKWYRPKYGCDTAMTILDNLVIVLGVEEQTSRPLDKT